ncbi:MAG: 2-oxoisovalerate dehydrogenase [Pseudomonadota bacterium]|nr:2-oxoisovalerate dehydrogenase [Pseudomonadota bacterium]OYY93638.1 MAG: 2-oxoisovalerate dehydrogenase [Hydrogenophilales bacterium 28-61-23]
MTEIHFLVEEAPEGGFIARAMGADVFTEADNINDLHTQIRDAVHCHFDEGQRPSLIRLHITREEVLAA